MAGSRKKIEPLSERFARAVLDARERRGLSQAELADRIGVSLNHVSKLEREVYSASFEMAARFMIELDMDANALIGAKPTPRAVSKKRREIEAQIIRLIEGMDERTLDVALEVLMVLARPTRKG